MDSQDLPEERSDSRFSGIDPETATTMLKRRMLTIGGVVGALMGVCWSFVAGLIFAGFPPIGSPTFLILTFLAIIILAGAGLLAGRYSYRKILSGK